MKKDKLDFRIAYALKHAVPRLRYSLALSFSCQGENDWASVPHVAVAHSVVATVAGKHARLPNLKSFC